MRILSICLLIMVVIASLVHPAPTYAAPAANPDNVGAAATLEDAQRAVVQIEAVGTFRDMNEGVQLNAAGRGSGFMIDPAGIAVTNNHVVTGGAYFKVWVAGESEPRTAKVLGVSECSDLAVIDIAGDGFPYLTWYPETVKVGLDVYALGFPLGDPEFTMTRGIIAKAKTDGRTPWAAVEHVLQHDADIIGGNSGGPLVDANGRVVGVNYAGNRHNQYFAISRASALPIIEQLRTGIDIDTIGVNGTAFVLDDTEFSGVWVASVASGSPADNVGLQPGDIILKLENVWLAEDGTMATYCDVLRSHSASDVMAIEVLRLDAKAVWKGQLNGRPLQYAYSIDEDPEPTVEPTTAPTTYTDYQPVSDQRGLITVEAPSAWQDWAEEEWVIDDEVVGLKLVIAPDVDRFWNGWDTPGVVVAVSEALAQEAGPTDLLDWRDYSDSCTRGNRKEYDSDDFTGAYDIWNECGSVGSQEFVVALAPHTGGYLLRIEGTIISDADLDALNRVIESFTYRSTPPTPTATPTPTAGNYHFVSNEVINASLPATWADTTVYDWTNDSGQKIGTIFSAAPDQAQYQDDWRMPGLTVSLDPDVTGEVDPYQLLNDWQLPATCLLQQQDAHEHRAGGQTYRGAFNLYKNCGGEDNLMVTLVAVPETVDHVVYIYFRMIDEADSDAFAVFADSFYVVTETTVTPRVAQIKRTQPSFAHEMLEDNGQMRVFANENASSTYDPFAGLAITVKAPNWIAWSSANVTVTDFLLETSAHAGGAPTGDYGVLFRQVDVDNFYVFTINTEGSYRLRKLVNNEWRDLIPWTQSSALHTGDRMINQLGVLAEGAQITLLINDVTVAQLEDDTFAAGDVALAAGSFDEGNTTVFFNHLNVWQIAN